MTEFQWRCPTHGVIDTVLDIINPDHPTCPVLLPFGAPGPWLGNPRSAWRGTDRNGAVGDRGRVRAARP